MSALSTTRGGAAVVAFEGVKVGGEDVVVVVLGGKGGRGSNRDEERGTVEKIVHRTAIEVKRVGIMHSLALSF